MLSNRQIATTPADPVHHHHHQQQQQQQQRRHTADSKIDPLFLTHKVILQSLRDVRCVYDTQLVAHLTSIETLYWAACDCAHTRRRRLRNASPVSDSSAFRAKQQGWTHNAESCSLTQEVVCSKCNKVSTGEVISFPALAFHLPEARTRRLHRSRFCGCSHEHYPPCGNCLQCLTGDICIVRNSFTCNLSTNAVCDLHNQLNEIVNGSIWEHLTDTSKLRSLRICEKHAHRHKPVSDGERSDGHTANYVSNNNINRAGSSSDETTPLCILQSVACCEESVLIQEFAHSFVVIAQRAPIKSAVSSGIRTRRQPGVSQYIVYDPQIWTEQTANHFFSFMKTVATLDAPMSVIKESYERFSRSNFRVASMQSYKSGKFSLVRTNLTGHEAIGLHQTATISCLLPDNEVLIPQNLYDLSSKVMDLDLVVIKRDPCFHETCAYVCRGRPHPDPTVNTIVIPDGISKPLNQDQDGDKNGIYAQHFFSRSGFDRRNSFQFRLAKAELVEAFRQTVTLIGSIRYRFSEQSLLMMELLKEELKHQSEFFRRFHHKGPTFMMEVGSGLLRKEYEEFRQLLIKINKDSKYNFVVTVDELLSDDPHSGLLSQVVESRAKGTEAALQSYISTLRRPRPREQRQADMIAQLNRYIESEHALTRNGRSQFILLHAAHDLIMCLGFLFLNKKLLANYNLYPGAGRFSFNHGTLDYFVDGLQDLAALKQRQ